MQLWIIRILKVWVDLHIWMCDPVLFPVTSIDVNECVEISDICGPNSICNNTVGSYNCSCMSGYNVTDPNLPINSSNPCKGMSDSWNNEQCVTVCSAWISLQLLPFSLSIILFQIFMNVLNQYQCVGQTLTVTITMEASHAFVGVDLMSVMEIQLLVKATLALVSLFIWYSASVWKSFSTFGYCKMYKYIYFITILPIRIQIIVIIILLEMLTFQPNLYTFWIDIFKCKLCL